MKTAGMPAIIEQHIEHGVLMRVNPEEVYDALATAEGLDKWFTRGARVDARPGGQIRFRWENWGVDRITAEDVGLVLEAVRPERLVFQWHPDVPAYATTVEISMEAVPGGTVVRLREHGFHDTPGGRKAMLECAVGWGEALTLLKMCLEQGFRC